MSKGDHGSQETWILGPDLSCLASCSVSDQSLPLFRPLSPICQAVGSRGRTGLGTLQGPNSTDPFKFCEREIALLRLALAVSISETHSNEN